MPPKKNIAYKITTVNKRLLIYKKTADVVSSAVLFLI